MSGKIPMLSVNPIVVAVVLTGCSNPSGVKPVDTGITSFPRTTYSCLAQDAWVTNPDNPPDEIPNNGAILCDFYQFSWQWFISLMTLKPGGQRTFQDDAQYRSLNVAVDSCATAPAAQTIFVRMRKDDDGQDDDFILPEDIHQALGDATIYDQNGNVVLYDVRFSADMCNVKASDKMFPAGTTEMKASWRMITDAEKKDYIWMNVDIDNNGKIEATELLGMVGFHLVKSTKLHPEFIWATFEHKKNAPDCQTTPASTVDWSFTSAACASQLPNNVNATACKFNYAVKSTELRSSTHSEVCQVYHAGTRPGDNQADTNIMNIDDLNKQLVGENGFLTQLPGSNPLAVLANYEIVGALWESDVALPSSNLENQRGSIQLANTTMETNAQQGFGEVSYTGTANLQPAANCFDCHGYTPGNNIGISHIFDKIHGPQQSRMSKASR